MRSEKGLTVLELILIIIIIVLAVFLAIFFIGKPQTGENGRRKCTEEMATIL